MARFEHANGLSLTGSKTSPTYEKASDAVNMLRSPDHNPNFNPNPNPNPEYLAFKSHSHSFLRSIPNTNPNPNPNPKVNPFSQIHSNPNTFASPYCIKSAYWTTSSQKWNCYVGTKQQIHLYPNVGRRSEQFIMMHPIPCVRPSVSNPTPSHWHSCNKA